VRRAGNGGEDVPPGPTPEEQAPPKKGKGTDEKVKEAQAAKLIKLARNAAEALFHTPDLVCYADVIVSGHRETWQVRSKLGERVPRTGKRLVFVSQKIAQSSSQPSPLSPNDRTTNDIKDDCG
jgi:hypothetical protein